MVVHIFLGTCGPACILPKGCMICQCYTDNLHSTLPVAAVLVVITVTDYELMFCGCVPTALWQETQFHAQSSTLALATISSYMLLFSYEPCLDVHDATLPPDVCSFWGITTQFPNIKQSPSVESSYRQVWTHQATQMVNLLWHTSARYSKRSLVVSLFWVTWL